MNDLANLYLAVRISDDEIAPSNTDRAGFIFDNDHGGEGTLEIGDDRLQCLVEGAGVEAEDRFWDGSGFLHDDSAPDLAVETISCNATHVGANNEFEISHPLCTGGNGDLANGRVHDICLTPGGTVGFMFNYRDAVGAGSNPEFGSEPSQPSGTYNPSIFHEIRALSGPPDFSITSSTPTISVTQGSSNLGIITVNSLNSFSSSVALSGSWVGSAPADVTFSLPTPITPPSGASATSPLTVNAGATASVGSFILRVTGTSGSLLHVVDVAVLILATTLTSTTTSSTTSSTASTFTTTTTGVVADFSMASASPTISVMQGSSSTVLIVVTSLNGFSSAVGLSSSWVGSAPTDVSFALPGPITPPAGSTASSTLTIMAGPSASVGAFVFRVTGTSGPLSHSVDLGVQVTPGATTTTTTTPAAPRCLIATAAYGSELAPEVQLLRNFRDNSILKTKVGANFMVAFNAWYYSFSPQVATYLSNHWVERTIMKVVLYPLIGILFLTSGLYSVTAANPEVAVFLSGVFASSLIGAFYIGLPLSVLRAKISRFPWRSSKRFVDKILAGMFISGGTMLVFGEFLNAAPPLAVSTSMIVLSVLFLSAEATSAVLAKKIQRY